MMDEFRMQPTGWNTPVTLDEMIAETARNIGLGRDAYYLATDADDLKDATDIITAARQYERARIVADIRARSNRSIEMSGTRMLRFLADAIEKGDDTPG